MKYLTKINDEFVVFSGKVPEVVLAPWPEDAPIAAVKYLESPDKIDEAVTKYWLESAKEAVRQERAERIKQEFDKCDMLIGVAAHACFGTWNVDAMNADKDTVIEILKGTGYLVGAGFRARRDLPEEQIVKGQVLNSKEDLERYATAMWQRILDYGQARVQLMAARDEQVEEIEKDYE